MYLSCDGLVSITIIFLWFDFSLKKVIKIDWQLVMEELLVSEKDKAHPSLANAIDLFE